MTKHSLFQLDVIEVKLKSVLRVCVGFEQGERRKEPLVNKLSFSLTWYDTENDNRSIIVTEMKNATIRK